MLDMHTIKPARHRGRQRLHRGHREDSHGGGPQHHKRPRQRGLRVRGGGQERHSAPHWVQDQFGESAPYERLLAKNGITTENIVAQAKSLL